MPSDPPIQAPVVVITTTHHENERVAGPEVLLYVKLQRFDQYSTKRLLRGDHGLTFILSGMRAESDALPKAKTVIEECFLR